MAFTSASGTGFAARIAGLAISMLALSAAAPPPTGTLDLQIEGLRSAKGEVQLCMTRLPQFFPGCKGDPAARRLTVAAREADHLHFADLPYGNYAIALIHDENGNDKLDTAFGIPREGFGFSMNPRLGFGAPKFAAAEFRVAGETTAQVVRVKYLL